MELEQAVGNVLKQLRVEKSLSQEELAHICGLDRTYISLIERGKRNPTINTLFILSSGLEILPSKVVLAIEELLNLSDRL